MVQQVRSLKLAIVILLAALLYVSQSKLKLQDTFVYNGSNSFELQVGEPSKHNNNDAILETTRMNRESPQQSQRRRAAVPAAPLENITWVGRQYYFPPGYKIYHPTEIRDLWRDTMWVGDSTMRRAMLTFRFMVNDEDLINKNDNALLAIEDQNYMNINKVVGGETANNITATKTTNNNDAAKQIRNAQLCDRYTNETTFPIDHEAIICSTVKKSHNNSSVMVLNDFFASACLEPFLEFLHRHPDVVRRYKVLTVSLGMYDIMGRCEGSKFREEGVTRLGRLDLRQSRALVLMDNLFRTLKLDFPNLIVVWRTMGFNSRSHLARDHLIANQKVLELLRSNYSTDILIADWATAVYDRSFDAMRLEGDNHYHYAHEARILFIQMMANLLDSFFQSS